MADLFAYGTLMAPQVFQLITNLKASSSAAKLRGFRRFSFEGQCYPGIMPANAGDCVEGLLYADIPPQFWPQLDKYESYVYERKEVRVQTPKGENTVAETYIVRPAYRHLLSDDEWDFDEFVSNHLARYLARTDLK
ncbi:MAG: gamma-glutamylcyclotransferase family protein [Pseudomonadota bacterium]